MSDIVVELVASPEDCGYSHTLGSVKIASWEGAAPSHFASVLGLRLSVSLIGTGLVLAKIVCIVDDISTTTDYPSHKLRKKFLIS